MRPGSWEGAGQPLGFPVGHRAVFVANCPLLTEEKMGSFAALQSQLFLGALSCYLASEFRVSECRTVVLGSICSNVVQISV